MIIVLPLFLFLLPLQYYVPNEIMPNPTMYIRYNEFLVASTALHRACGVG